MEVTIDLGLPTSLHRMEVGFLQDINAWIFLPEEIRLSVSNDGRDFRQVVQVTKVIPQNRKGVWSVPYTAEFSTTEARYVRLKATNLKTCLGWHKGAGQPCWVFADEITLE